MSKHRILVVDDDHDILELLEYNLEREGFKVKTWDTGNHAVDECIEFDPDLIILDIMLPEINGIELCRRIRAIERFKETFIFFLTARSESYYQEAALDTGGDDYIEKIIGLRMLTNKIRAVLSGKFIIRKRDVIIEIGDLRINRRAASAKVKGREIPLSKPEFELLFFFAQNPDKVLAPELVISNIWDSESSSSSNSPEIYLDMLIKKLGGHWLFKLSNGKYTLSTK